MTSVSGNSYTIPFHIWCAQQVSEPSHLAFCMIDYSLTTAGVRSFISSTISCIRSVGLMSQYGMWLCVCEFDAKAGRFEVIDNYVDSGFAREPFHGHSVALL